MLSSPLILVTILTIWAPFIVREKYYSHSTLESKAFWARQCTEPVRSCMTVKSSTYYSNNRWRQMWIQTGDANDADMYLRLSNRMKQKVSLSIKLDTWWAFARHFLSVCGKAFNDEMYSCQDVFGLFHTFSCQLCLPHDRMPGIQNDKEWWG